MSPRLLQESDLARISRYRKDILAEQTRPETPVTFDIFLSHSRSDKDAVVGLATKLETMGLKVYVDWIYDPDRGDEITPKNARLLQRRMKASDNMLYAISTTATQSKWMPWELGYFDGLDKGRIAIVPIASEADQSFDGQEYLGLHPFVANDESGVLTAFGTTASLPYMDWLSLR